MASTSTSTPTAPPGSRSTRACASWRPTRPPARVPALRRQDREANLPGRDRAQRVAHADVGHEAAVPQRGAADPARGRIEAEPRGEATADDPVHERPDTAHL